MVELLERSKRLTSMVVAVLLLLAVAVLLSLGLHPVGGGFSAGESDQVSPARPVDNEGYSSPRDAALAWAQTLDPDSGFEVSRVVLIHADDRSVDLRVNVSSDDVCRWVGVAGQAEDGRLTWTHSAGKGLGC